MDALKIEKAAVAGDSVGGSICLPLARDRGALSQRHAGAAETLEHRPQRGRRVQANVAVLPECGHFPMIDDPPLFVREVNRLTDAVAR
jgi:pimeloyl-ACP methyl ester carboxylesterase